MKNSIFTVVLILAGLGLAHASSALNIDDFKCSLSDDFDGNFVKVGSTATLISKSLQGDELQTRQYYCDAGTSAKYSATLFCHRKEIYTGVAQHTEHLIFLDNFTKLIRSSSNYSPSGEVLSFGTGAYTTEVKCE